MRSLQRVLTVLGVSAAILAATAATAQADSSELANPLVNDETGGHYALYNGEWVDMSEGVPGAEVCMEQLDTSVVCYDDMYEYRVSEGLPTDGPRLFAFSDCKDNHLCLWDNKGYSGFLIGFQVANRKDLRDYHQDEYGNKGVADLANSVYNNRDTISGLEDVAKVRNDNSCSCMYEIIFNSSINNLGGVDVPASPYNLNNKIDHLVLT